MKNDFMSMEDFAKKYSVSLPQLYFALKKLNYVVRKNQKWELTELGREMGGHMRYDGNSSYIVWIDVVWNFPLSVELGKKRLTVLEISRHFNTTEEHVLSTLLSLHWIEGNLQKYHLTKLGIKMGGEEVEYLPDPPEIRWEE